MAQPPRQAQDIVSRAIPKDRKDVPTCSLSSLAYLLSELIQYTQSRCRSHAEVESRLQNAGYEVGQRVVELLGYRDGPKQKRALEALDAVKQIGTRLWPYLFGHGAEHLEQDTEREDKFYIIVDSIQYTKFMSPPASSGANAADTSSYFVAGIVKGYLDCSGFPAEVDATYQKGGKQAPRTVIIVTFEEPVMDRERRAHR